MFAPVVEGSVFAKKNGGLRNPFFFVEKKFAKKWRMTYSNFFVEKSFCRKKNGGLRSQFFLWKKAFGK